MYIDNSSYQSQARPLIVGIGGTPRAASTSERALQACLAHARKLGAETRIFVGEDLDLPMYRPGATASDPKADAMVEALRNCDGLIIASPSYHGSISGMLKNALDYTEDLREDQRPYLDTRPVGCIVCSAGWQAVGTTLTAMRSIVHALRGWPSPLGVGFNTIDPVFDAQAALSIEDPAPPLVALAEQVVGFANRFEKSPAFQKFAAAPDVLHDRAS